MRKNVPIRKDLHQRASAVAKSMGGVKLQSVADWAFELWLAKNEKGKSK